MEVAGCKVCSPGTYVKPEKAPGKAKWECTACPDGKTKLCCLEGSGRVELPIQYRALLCQCNNHRRNYHT